MFPLRFSPGVYIMRERIILRKFPVYLGYYFPCLFFAFALLYSLSYSSVPSFASLHFAFEITFYVVDFHFLTFIFSVSSWAANSVPSVYFFSSPLVCQSQPFSSLLSVSGIVHGIHWSVLFLCLLSLSFFYLFKCSFMFHHPFLLHYLN